MAVDPYQYYGYGSEQVISGPAEGGTRRRTFPRNTEEIAQRLRELRGEARQELLRPGGMFKNQAGDYRRALGGKSSAALGALQTTLEDPVAGLLSAPVGIGAGGIANVATTALTQGLMAGPAPSKAVGMALRYFLPAAVGYQAQQGTARGIQNLMGTAPSAIQGAAQTASEGGGLFGIGSSLQDLELPVPIVGGSIAIGERAKRRREAAYGREERVKDVRTELALLQEQSNLNLRNELAFAREMGQIQNQNMINQTKALAPIIADAQRRELAGQQSLMNTQGAIYQRLGRMAGMFQLAERGMSESGALARTMAANSPYQAAIMPAPQISFGN